jgi:adenylyltransferase/sulfurtransferase
MPPELPLEISCQQTASEVAADPSIVLLDCREQDEWDLVNIDDAVLLPMSQIAGRVSELEPHREHRVIVYCHHGGRSARVAQWLRQQGFAGAQSMAGGIDEWAQTIEPGMTRY